MNVLYSIDCFLYHIKLLDIYVYLRSDDDRNEIAISIFINFQM